MKDRKLHAEKTLGTLSNKMNVFWKEEMCTRIQEALEDCYSRGYYVGRAEGEQAQKQIKAECAKASGDEFYEKGLEDAMKAIRLLCLEPRNGGMYMDDIHTLFGSRIKFEELMNLPAKEVVCKVLGYFEKKKVEEERLKSGFEIGDEVRLSYEDADSYAGKGVVVSNGKGGICVLWEDGTVGDEFGQRDLEKTGKRHDALRVVLGSLGKK